MREGLADIVSIHIQKHSKRGIACEYLLEFHDSMVWACLHTCTLSSLARRDTLMVYGYDSCMYIGGVDFDDDLTSVCTITRDELNENTTV